MFPHRSLFLAILRVAIFSIEVPEVKSITCLRRQPRARNALSFGTKVLKMAPEELPEITTGGGFHFTFFIYWTRLLFHLIMETFFTVHGNPVSSSFLQIRKSFVCLFFGINLNHKQLLRFVCPFFGIRLPFFGIR